MKGERLEEVVKMEEAGRWRRMCIEEVEVVVSRQVGVGSNGRQWWWKEKLVAEEREGGREEGLQVEDEVEEKIRTWSR